MKYSTGKWEGWPKNRTAVIAEIGMNHGGDEGLAWEMIKRANENGADFAKLQSYTTEELLHPSLPYFSNTKGMELSFEAQKRLFEKAKEAGIKLLTTPYDFAAVDMVDIFEPAAYKIASMDNDNIPLIRYIAEKQRPVLIAAGMADLEEIQNIMDIMKQTGNDKLVLLHCISDYPAKPENLNLSMIQFLKDTFNVPVGTSDHSLGLLSSFIAASLGCIVIEKHFTTDRALMEKIPNADHDISILPDELKRLREFCESVPVMMGSAPRKLSENETRGRQELRRGIYAKRDMDIGERLTLENVVFLRPVRGIKAGLWDKVKDSTIKKKISKLEPVSLSDLDI